MAADPTTAGTQDGISSWFPTEWRLDVVTLLAVIGESSST